MRQWWRERTAGPPLRQPCPACGRMVEPDRATDERLIAVLTMLQAGIPAVVEQIQAGTLPADQRRMLAVQLRNIADDLWTEKAPPP